MMKRMKLLLAALLALCLVCPCLSLAEGIDTEYDNLVTSGDVEAVVAEVEDAEIGLDRAVEPQAVSSIEENWPGDVAFDAINFPDATFRDYVRRYDTNLDGVLSRGEAVSVVEMYVNNKGITSLKGIEYFYSLQQLDCSGNQLTSLDVRENVHLDFLDCYNNQLSTLDLSQNHGVRLVYCYGNNITRLDLSGCSNALRDYVLGSPRIDATPDIEGTVRIGINGIGIVSVICDGDVEVTCDGQVIHAPWPDKMYFTEESMIISTNVRVDLPIVFEPEGRQMKVMYYSNENDIVDVFFDDGFIVGRKAGKATITATGENGDIATLEVEVSDKKLIKDCAIDVYNRNFTYTGESLKPEISLMQMGVKLTEGTDYTVEYIDNQDAGTGTYVITGIGDYFGTVSGSFTISAATLSGCTITGVKDATYTGKAISPKPTVQLNGSTLKKGTDYTVTYSKNTAVGTATMTITGKGNYSGTAKTTFTINPKKVSKPSVKAGKKKLTVSWKKVKGITGYEIQYGTKSNFSDAKTVRAKKSATSTSLKKLKAKKTYYVRIRAYKTVNKQPIYSAWSKTVKKKTK